MAATDREEIERRVLALVRDYLDYRDERFERDYDIGDFVIVWQVIENAPESDAKPWDGGPTAGWVQTIGYSSTARSWWIDEALLEVALSGVRESRDAEDDTDD